MSWLSHLCPLNVCWWSPEFGLFTVSPSVTVLFLSIEPALNLNFQNQNLLLDTHPIYDCLVSWSPLIHLSNAWYLKLMLLTYLSHSSVFSAVWSPFSDFFSKKPRNPSLSSLFCTFTFIYFDLWVPPSSPSLLSLPCLGFAFYYFLKEKNYLTAPGFSCGMWTCSCSTWDLVHCPGIEPGPPALGAWHLSQCTTRQVLILLFNWMHPVGLPLICLPPKSNHQITKISILSFYLPVRNRGELCVMWNLPF